MTLTDSAPRLLVQVQGLASESLRLVADPASRTHWFHLLCALLIATLVVSVNPRAREALSLAKGGWRAAFKRWAGPSARVDYLLIVTKPIVWAVFALPFALSAHALAISTVRTLDAHLGLTSLTFLSDTQVTLVYAITLFVAWDLSRYLLHLALHRVPALWQLHQVHHSAETLTPFTLYRVHPIESALYHLRGVLVTGVVTGLFFFLFRARAIELQLFGVNAFGFLASAISGNLRHSHVWWTWGTKVERWFISPAQHQLHHAREAGDQRVNYGTWLSIWDRMNASLRIASDAAPPAFGLEAEHRNHDPHSLLSALIDPLVSIGSSAWSRVRGRRAMTLGALASAFLLPAEASAQAPERPEVVKPPEAPGPVDFQPSADAQSDEASAHPDAEHAADAELDESEGNDEVEDPDADLDMSDLYDDPPLAGADTQSADDGVEAEIGSKDVKTDIAAPTVTIVAAPEDLPRVVGSAHVIDSDTLERDENDSIHDALRTVPGVYVRGEDGFGLRPNIGLRGVDSNRSSKITLMEDGILLGPAPYAAPAAYYFPLTTRMTGIEVFKGPAALRHGPNTIGGAINLRTRDIPLHSTGGSDFALGQRGYNKSHGFWGRSWKHFGMLLEGARIGSDGFKELDNGESTGFAKKEGMLKLRANLDPAARVYHQFDLKAGVSTERSFETYLGLSDEDFAENPYRRYDASQAGLMQWWRSQAQLSYLLAFDELVEFQATAYRNDFSRSWRKFNSFRGGPDIADIIGGAGGQAPIYLDILRGEANSSDDNADQALLIGTNDRRYSSQGLQNLLRISPSSQYVDQVIELGARFHYDTIRRDHTEEAFLMNNGVLVPELSEVQTTSLNRGSAYAGAFHLHDEIIVAERFTVSPGARVELIKTEFVDDLDDTQSEAFNAVFLPGMGAHFEATPWLGVLAGVHSGFSPVAPGQPEDVSPERSVNYEAGFRLGNDALRGFRGEAIGFFNDYSNLTGECTFAQGCDDANLGNQFNAGEVRVAGAELGAGYDRRFKRGSWLRGDANYTLTWSQFQGSFISASPQFGEVEAGDALPYLPMHVASIKLAGGSKRVGLWSTLAFNGEMRDLPGLGAIPSEELIPRFVTLDLGGRVWISDRASVYMNVMNVTGAKYMVSRRPLGARPGRPRFGLIGFKYSFAGKMRKESPEAS